VFRVIALWVVPGVAVLLYAISRATAMPAARGVPVSVRFAAARDLVARAEPLPGSARPSAHPMAALRHSHARTQPRSRVAYCDGRMALAERRSRRS
jgi:hypothetical protein